MAHAKLTRLIVWATDFRLRGNDGPACRSGVRLEVQRQ